MHPVQQYQRFIPDSEVTMFSNFMFYNQWHIEKDVISQIKKPSAEKKLAPLCNVMCLKSNYIQKSNRPSFPLILNHMVVDTG